MGRVFSTGRDVVSASEMVGERALHYTARQPRRASSTKKKTGLRRKRELCSYRFSLLFASS